jgi:serine/threonine protein kinase/tetratricopeptide (TPR) repeat protein/class 3 adenylate cyclase
MTTEISEWKVVSVLFADIVGYTKITENLSSDEIKELLDGVFGAAKQRIELYRGRVENIVGDEIVGFFGTPYPNEQHSEAAIRTALGIQEDLVKIGRTFFERHGLRLTMRFGVCSGRVLVGSNVEQGHSLTGPPMVLGKRLETAAKPGTILVNRLAMESTQTQFDFEPTSVPAKHDKTYEGFRVSGMRDSVLKGRGLETPFVGRKRERTALLERSQEVTEAFAPRVVTLTGVPGMGKSRLVHRLVADLEDRGQPMCTGFDPDQEADRKGWTLFWGHAQPFMENAHFSIFRDLFERFLGNASIEEGAESWSILLDRWGIEEPRRFDLRALFESSELSECSEEEALLRSEKQLRDLSGLFGEISFQTPLVIVLEGLQWADERSLQAIEFLQTQRTSGVPILFLNLAGDPIEFPRLFSGVLGTVDRMPGSSRYHLGPLDEASMREILAGISGLQEHPRACEKILDRAEGNPYFLQEILTSLMAQNQIVRAGSGWQVAEPFRVRIPESLATALISRLDRMVPPEKLILQYAAVIGVTFREDDLQRILPESLPRFADHLEDLCAHGLLRPIHRKDGAAYYEFGSPLLQQVAGQTLLRSQRVLCHRKLASHLRSTLDLQEGDPSRLVEMAEHQFQSEDWSDAIESFRLASRRSRDHGNHQASIRLLGRALRTSRNLGREVEEEIPLLIDLARAQSAAGKTSSALETYALLLESPYEEGLEGEQRADVHLGRGFQLRSLGRLGEARDALEIASQLLAGSGEALELRALRALVRVHCERQEFEAASERLEQARRVEAARLDGEAIQLDLLEASLHLASGNLAPCHGLLERIEAHFKRVEDRYGQARVEVLRARMERAEGRSDRVEEHQKRAGELLGEIGVVAGAVSSGAVEKLDQMLLDSTLAPEGESVEESLVLTLLQPGAVGDQRAQVQRHRAEVMARIALARNWMSAEQVNQCLERVWQDPDSSFEVRAGSAGFLNPELAPQLLRQASEDILREEGSEVPGYRMRPRPGNAPVFVRNAESQIGPYEIQGKLGEGGMGVVYRALDPQLEREVALKVLSGHRESEIARVRFEREARAAARMHHPGIVPIYDLSIDDQLCYYTMELIEGQSLKEWMKERSGRVDPRQWADLIQKVAEAVHYAHSHGVVHRDIKPANILLRPTEEPAILDFGIARSADDIDITSTGQLVGTPAYMSPEQARGEETGTASDVYSLGVLIYEGLAGRLPFLATTPSAMIEMIKSRDPDDLGRVRSGLPRDIVTICERAMRKEPENRYPSAASLAEDLRCFLEGDPIRARRMTGIERTWRLIRKHQTLAITVGISALLLIGSLAGLSWKNRLEKHRLLQSREATALDQVRGLQKEFQRIATQLPAVDQLELREPNGELNEETIYAWFDAQTRALVPLEKLSALHLRAPTETVIEAVDIQTVGEQRLLLCRKAWARAVELQKYVLAHSWVDRLVGTSIAESILTEAHASIDRARKQDVQQRIDAARELLVQARRPETINRGEDWYEDHLRTLMALKCAPVVRLLLNPEHLDSRHEWERRLSIEALGAMGDTRTRGPEGKDAVEALIERLKTNDLGQRFDYGVRLVRALGALRDVRAYDVVRKIRLSQRGEDRFDIETQAAFARLPLPERLRGTSGEEQSQVDGALLFDQGKVQMERGELKAALSSFDELISRFPKRPEGYYHRARARMKLGSHAEAEEDLDRAIALYPKNPMFHFTRGICRRYQNDLPGAIENYSRAIELDPEMVKAYHNRGITREELDDLKGAEADYLKALEYAPMFSMTRLNLASLYRQMGRNSEALAILGRLIRDVPKFSEASFRRGEIYRRSGEFSRAIEDYTRAIESDPDYVDAYAYRGQCKQKLKDLEGAKTDYDRAIEVLTTTRDQTRAITFGRSDALPYRLRADLLTSQGQTDLALADLGRAIEIDSRSTSSYYSRGMIWSRQGNLERAIADFTQVTQLNPKYAPGFYQRGIAWARQGDLRRAIEDFTRSIECSPKSPEGYFNRGKARKLVGEISGAIEDYQKVLELTSPKWKGRAQVENILKDLREQAAGSR